MRTITPRSEAWPQALSELGPHPTPPRLHLSGCDLDPMSRCVAIVGARRPTSAGLHAARTLACSLAEAGFTIVSGLAVGIDAAAHQGALAAGGTTVAVLGCGIDVDYPAANRKLKKAILERGSLLSEYDAGAQPQPWHFPERNRIVAGLCSATVFVEGTLRSGGLITARIALDAGRSVFAVPGSIRNPLAQGPNELIRTGRAALVTDVRHILEDLAPALVWETPVSPERSVPELPAIESAVLALMDDAGTSPDLIGRELGAAEGAVLLALARLEVRGWVERTGRGYAITTGGARIRLLQSSQP